MGKTLDNTNVAEAKANVSILTTNNWSTLHYAAKYCKDTTYFFEQIFLLNPSLLVKRTSGFKSTVLWIAVEAGNIETVRYILNKTKTLTIKQRFPFVTEEDDGPGLLINAIGGCDREPPLHVAARKGFYDIVELLLEYGADRSLQNGNKMLASTIATDDKVLELLYNFPTKK